MHPEIKRGGKRSSFYLIINRLFVSPPFKGRLKHGDHSTRDASKNQDYIMLKVLHNDQLGVNA